MFLLLKPVEIFGSAAGQLNCTFMTAYAIIQIYLIQVNFTPTGREQNEKQGIAF